MMLDRVIARLQALRAELGRDVPVLVVDGEDEYDFALSSDEGAAVVIDTTATDSEFDGELDLSEPRAAQLLWPCPFG